MKNCLLFLVLLYLLQIRATAQNPAISIPGGTSHAASNAIALGLSFPLGTFNRTHTPGISVDYSYSNLRYGNQRSTYSSIKFTMHGGASYHAGKSAPVAGYEFQYGGYFALYAAAGIDYKPSQPVNISLTAGPMMSFYEGSTSIGAGVNAFWNYFISQKVAIGPGISFKKQSKAEALWTGVIRASYVF